METSTNSNRSFGERLELFRKEKSLTAKQVAEAVGVPESTYRDWEKGRGKLPPLQRLSEVLAISVTELILGQKPELASHLEDLEAVEKRLREIRVKLSSRI